MGFKTFVNTMLPLSAPQPL